MSDKKDRPSQPTHDEKPPWHRPPERIDEKRNPDGSTIISNTWPPPNSNPPNPPKDSDG